MIVENKENIQKTENGSDKKDKEVKEVDSLNPKSIVGQEEEKKNPVGFFKLIYLLADRTDITIICFAILGSLIAGASMPLISLLLGKVLNQFNGNIDVANVPGLVSGLITNFLLVGISIFISSCMMVFFWNLTGRRLINKLNTDYFRVIMLQEQGWFDTKNKYEFATKVQIQIKTIENGIGQKVGAALMSVSQFIVSFLVGYVTSWKLSLVLTSMLPFLGIGGWFMSKAMEQGSVTSRTYEKAGGMAEEVLHQIKTVASFANFEYEQKKYGKFLEDSLKAGLKAGFKTGFGIGFIIFVVYCSYALAVGVGSKLISGQSINENSGDVFGAGDVITVLFSIIFGCFSLGQGAPNIKAIYEAKYAAIEYFELRNRPQSKNLEMGNLKPNKDELLGQIAFENVIFSYPSQSNKIILNGFTMNFEHGKKTAIVGGSGSGKSTVLALVERFYLPTGGSIKIDNFDINTLDLKYWRSLIGYVPQEPVLFNTTIRNNIIFGRGDVTDDEIRQACDKAYATEFVSTYGLDYIVGIKGGRLSGGQKQRIAIARAILKKPKLLILDEATSALDNKSEKEVQKALDIVSQGVTTIVIAHKISTIKNSDKIIFLADGVVKEHGTHNELLAMMEGYYNLVQSAIEKKRKKTLNSELKMSFHENSLHQNEENHGEEDEEDAELYTKNIKLEPEKIDQNNINEEQNTKRNLSNYFDNKEFSKELYNSEKNKMADTVKIDYTGTNNLQIQDLKNLQNSGKKSNISKISDKFMLESPLQNGDRIDSNFKRMDSVHSMKNDDSMILPKSDIIIELKGENLDEEHSHDKKSNNKLKSSNENFNLKSSIESIRSPKKNTDDKKTEEVNMNSTDKKQKIINLDREESEVNANIQINLRQRTSSNHLMDKAYEIKQIDPSPDSQRKLSSFKDSTVKALDPKQLTIPENIINNNKKPEEEVPVDPNYFKQSRRKLIEMLKENKGFVAGGMIAAACNGTVWPIYGVLLADAIGVLSNKDMEQVSQGGLNVSMMFLTLAVLAAVVLWMQNYFFYGIGEILTKKFREKVFEKFLNFHMGFFDRTENSPGSLLTKLSSDTTKINGVALSIIGQLIQTAVTLILGLTLAMVYQWKLCLINVCFMPLIIGNYVIQFRVQKGSAEGNENIEMESGSILSETLINTRTIFSYNMEDKVVEFYSKILKGFNKNMYCSSSINGLLYGVSQFVIFGMYATLFYVGGNLYSENLVTLQNMMRAIFIVLFTALGVGIAQAFVGDYQAAKHAIVSIYKILDEPSQIDVAQTEISGVKKANYEGKIEFRNVSFSYPTNPSKIILSGLNFTIYPGQNVAFVGASGSGKSTIISLIERFYDVNGGQVLVDDIDIKDYDLKDLRRNIGLVMQEPALFKRTLMENIKYGRLDATDSDVHQAAKDAYIDNILQVKAEKEDDVSGGEKQRVAIARAILKNPVILLLDEATSALDANSEIKVKESLNILMKNRTSVVVAHRLSTIIHCDVIFVLEKGKIVELGNHYQLMEMQGRYFSLYNYNNN